MLALENRLAASSDITRVVTVGSRIRVKNVALYSAPSDKGLFRFACVAGKKVHQSSVVRHAVQRKLRAACRKAITALSGSCDIVVVALSPSIQYMKVLELEQEIISGLKKLGVTSNK